MTRAPCASQDFVRTPFEISQALISWPLPLTSILPSGLQASASIHSKYPGSIRNKEFARKSHKRIVAFASPLASVLPSGLTATEFTALACPTREGSEAPDDKFHRLIVLSRTPPTSVLPSGLKAIEPTPLRPTTINEDRPVAASQILIESSALLPVAAATVLPSTLKATALTGFKRLGNSRRSARVETSQR